MSMKKWMEKEFSHHVYYDEEDGKIIGAVNKAGNSQSVYVAKIYEVANEGYLGQYVNGEYARKAVENYWDIKSRVVLEMKNES
jgi:hypothetical protein